MVKRGGWGFIGSLVLAVVAVLSCSYMAIRTFWPFESSYSSQLQDAGYPKPEIEKTTTSMGGNKTQGLYIARTRVGTCLLRFDRTQYENGYKLVEVNGEPIKLGDSPTKQETLDFLRGRGIDCIKPN